MTNSVNGPIVCSYYAQGELSRSTRQYISETLVSHFIGSLALEFNVNVNYSYIYYATIFVKSTSRSGVCTYSLHTHLHNTAIYIHQNPHTLFLNAYTYRKMFETTRVENRSKIANAENTQKSKTSKFFFSVTWEGERGKTC